MSRGVTAPCRTVGDPMTETNMLRVLVAEDNALERSTLVDLLGALGHLVVAEVSTGPEAVAQARRAPTIRWAVPRARRASRTATEPR